MALEDEGLHSRVSGLFQEGPIFHVTIEVSFLSILPLLSQDVKRQSIRKPLIRDSLMIYTRLYLCVVRSAWIAFSWRF